MILSSLLCDRCAEGMIERFCCADHGQAVCGDCWANERDAGPGDRFCEFHQFFHPFDGVSDGWVCHQIRAKRAD